MVTPKSPNRARSLIRLGAGLAGSYFAYQLRRPFSNAATDAKHREALHKKSARQVREELQKLRGPLMKLGQAMSMQTHALGPDWIKELSALQMQAPPMHYSLMRVQFKAAIGKYPEEVFKSFDEQPFAAASLGQVHWAVTKQGEEVAVKIQYPAVREAIDNDFKMLRTAGWPIRLTGHLEEKQIAEIHRGIMEEADYTNEARNLTHFAHGLKSLAYVRVPRVFKDLSGDRVLTMSRVPGVRLQEFLEQEPKQEIRNEIGERLVRLFFFQVFKMRAVHADPHPGNYLFNRDGTISLVDFGCVKHLKPEVANCYAQMWARQWVHDPELYAHVVKTILGSSNPNLPRIRRTMDAIRKFYDEFHPFDKPNFAPDAGDPYFMERLSELATILVQNKFLSPEYLFLSRTESGMCNLLHILKARTRTATIARELIPTESL